MLNLIEEQDDIDKIYLYAKDLSEPKYEFLIKKHKDTGVKHFNDPRPFIEHPNIYNDIDDYNALGKEKF